MEERISNETEVTELRNGRKLKVLHSIPTNKGFLYCTDYYIGTGFWLYRDEFLVDS